MEAVVCSAAFVVADIHPDGMKLAGDLMIEDLSSFAVVVDCWTDLGDDEVVADFVAAVSLTAHSPS